MSAELPHCAVCRVAIKSAENVVFRPDGRVQHTACPEVICPICSQAVMPDDPIRRDGEAPVHGNCWGRRLRAAAPSDGNARRAAVIRGKLRAGTLPSDTSTTTCGGYGSGQLCDGCGERIAVGASEYEVDFTHSVTLRLHQGCFVIWREERAPAGRGTISGGSGADPAAHAEVLRATAETLLMVTETLSVNQAVRARAAMLRKEARCVVRGV